MSIVKCEMHAIQYFNTKELIMLQIRVKFDEKDHKTIWWEALGLKTSLSQYDITDPESTVRINSIMHFELL